MGSFQVNLIEPPKVPTYTTYLPSLEYEELPTSTSIRLLRIDRLPTIKDNLDLFRPITCSLVVKDLNDRPRYNALSYTWGDPLDREESSSDSTAPGGWATTPFGITCNDQRVRITTNLHTALIAIRYYLSKTQTPVSQLPFVRMSEYIWVDQICINQADISEKSSQVQLMGRIYRECVLVHIWLGGHRKDIEDMKYVQQPLEPLNWNVHECAKYKGLDMLDRQTCRVLGIRPITRKRARGMVKFFNRAWFKRSWVLQEEVLAPMSNALFGLTLMPFHQHLIGFMAFLKNTGWFDKLFLRMEHKDLESTVISEFFSNIERVAYSLGIRNYFIQDQYWGCSLPLGTITRMFRTSEATDPRDKVYAFIGLTENDAAQKAAPIVPDYSLSVESVYIDATKLIMKSKGFNLEVFSQREDEKLRLFKSLPSWVPDFSVPVDHSPMAAMGPMWTAAGLKAPTNYIRYLPSDCIELHGTRVDKISSFNAGPNVSSKKTRELVYISAIDVLELMASVPEISTIKPPTSSPSLTDEFHERNGGPTVLRPLNIAAAQKEVSRDQSKGEVFWRTMLQDTADNSHPARDGCGKEIFKDMEDAILLEMSQLIAETTLNSMNDEKWIQWMVDTDKFMREFTNLQILKGTLPYGIEDTQNPKHFAGARTVILSQKKKG